MDLLAALHRFVFDHPQHALAALLLVSRLADVVSTWLVTPTLRLEGNPIVRRLGWPFAWATLLVAGVAYLPDAGPPIALAASVLSLFVAAENLSKLPAVRAQGEELAQRNARRVLLAAPASAVYGAILGRAAAIALAGLALLALYPSADAWAFSFGEGVLLYALAIAGYSGLATWRVRAAAARAERDQL